MPPSAVSERNKMAKVQVERVDKGLRASEALVTVNDFHGRTHVLRVERDFLSEHDNRPFLPFGIVHVDTKSKAVLIELPHEAETGANRLWVASDKLDEPI